MIYKIRNFIYKRLKLSFIGRLIMSLLQRPINGSVCIVSATRYVENDFWTKSALGQSLIAFRESSLIKFKLYFNNTQGLSYLYNDAINKSKFNDILIFVHDDVWIDDADWIENAKRGLGIYDLIGLAGNQRLSSEQPAWIFKSFTEKGFIHDTEYLSGTVYMGDNPMNKEEHFYGNAPLDCKVLDGLFLCAKAKTLKLSKTFFDEQFEFHFYDMDFCRTAITHGLRLGTWNIKVVHQSMGAFGGSKWKEGYVKYLNKWNYL
jgi:protein O-GlcNAc transferase